MPYPLDRPPADPGRTETAARFFAEGLSPEEVAARNAHAVACFSLDEIRYADPELDAWIQRLGDILSGRDGAPTVAQLRERYLTPDEIAAIARDGGDF